MTLPLVEHGLDSVMPEQAQRKAPKYWQTVRRFGLPFGVVYLFTDSVMFRITDHGRFSWGWHLVEDVLAAFLVSTLWWWLVVKPKTD
jgi:hypothetical protein